MANRNDGFGGFNPGRLLGDVPKPFVPKVEPLVDFEELAELAKQRRERDQKNDGNVEVTAQALRDMLAITQAESAAAKERDRLAQERDAAAKRRDEDARKSQKWNLRVAVGSFIAAVLAVIAPFVIEGIKGWQ